MSAATVAFDRELVLSHEPPHPTQPPYANTTYDVKARIELVMIESMMFRFNSIIHHECIVSIVVGTGRLSSRNGFWPACKAVGT